MGEGVDNFKRSLNVQARVFTVYGMERERGCKPIARTAGRAIEWTYGGRLVLNMVCSDLYS